MTRLPSSDAFRDARDSSALRALRAAGLALAVATALAGCGGGSVDVTPDPATQPVTFAGAVTKGPVSGARVCASWLVDGAVDAATTTCTDSGADGAYALTMPRRAALLLVEATQGAYADEADPGVRVPLSRLRGALAFDGPESRRDLQVSALTELAVVRAQALGGLRAEPLAAAKAEVERSFGVTGIERIRPADLTQPQVSGLDATTRYGLVNAGVRGWMAERGRPAAALDAALAELAARMAAGTLHEELVAFRAGIRRVIVANPGSGLASNASAWSQAIGLDFGRPPPTPVTPALVEAAGSLRYAVPWANPALAQLTGGAPLACVTNVPAGTAEDAVRAAAAATVAPFGQTAATLLPVAACLGSGTAFTIDFPSGRVVSGDRG
ncbi:MAG: hypothetical protein EHM87_14130 [Burkholderiales bacterium]|nr:MAG: hypothetical protein EHM87_14130 [Burkholderiales bacterium]